MGSSNNNESEKKSKPLKSKKISQADTQIEIEAQKIELDMQNDELISILKQLIKIRIEYINYLLNNRLNYTRRP